MTESVQIGVIVFSANPPRPITVHGQPPGVESGISSRLSAVSGRPEGAVTTKAMNLWNVIASEPLSGERGNLLLDNARLHQRGSRARLPRRPAASSQ